MDVIYLGIAKAYDSAWRHIILIKLNSLLCQDKLLNIISNFITNRKFQVKANNLLFSELYKKMEFPKDQPSQLLYSLKQLTISPKTASHQ